MSPSAQPDALAKPTLATRSRRGQCRGAHSLAAARFLHPPRKVCRFGPCLLRGTPRATEPIEPVRRVTASLGPRTGSHAGLASQSLARAEKCGERTKGADSPSVVLGRGSPGRRCFRAFTPLRKGALRAQAALSRMGAPSVAARGTRHTPTRASRQSASSGPRTRPGWRPHRGLSREWTCPSPEGCASVSRVALLPTDCANPGACRAA